MRCATSVCVHLGRWCAHRHELVDPKVKSLLEIRTIHIHDKDTSICFPKVNPIESVVIFLACCVPNLDCAVVNLFEFAVDVHRFFRNRTERIVCVSYQEGSLADMLIAKKNGFIAICR